MNPLTSRRPLRALSPPWVWTLCLALALRTLVPVGTMLDFETRGGFFPGLVLCAVQNPGLSLTGHHHADEPPQSHASPLCLLAQHVGGSPLLGVAPAPALAAASAVVTLFFRAVAPPAQRVRGAPLGSRAPPVLSTDRPFFRLRII